LEKNFSYQTHVTHKVTISNYNGSTMMPPW